METTDKGNAPRWKAGSYRTYEEWKHRYHLFFPPSSGSSYRTYEEWKLCDVEFSLWIAP